MSSTILVVEDEPAIQELIAVNLSFAGHKVLRAFDVGQAETLIRAELPDLIILDWMLPGTSGLALAKKLRSDARTRTVPDQVWGDHVFVEERTVDVHIRRLRKALEPSGHDAHVETVRGSGYRFTGSLPAN